MFQIVVDSGANIPAELVRHYDIRVLSFINITDGKPLVCFNPDLTIEEERSRGKEYYDAIRNGMKVQTGLIGCGEFEDCFREICE
ncbi:MAG: DegV family protein, partial [Lachnospiraceae bacterium]|nr:DegV family protein [Lachnospiraceae bacterium]